MNESRAAVRYAKAILNSSLKNKVNDVVEKDMRTLLTTISENNQLQELLSSPVIKGEAKKSALLAVFKGVHATTEGLLTILIANKRIELLPDVAQKYILLNEALKGQDVGYVTTAVPMNAALEKKILKKVGEITGNTVTLENTVDESIIGGFILRVGDLQYDASIASKLNTIKREFTNSL